MRFLRHYFGEDAQLDCGQCDNCRSRQDGDLEDALADVPPAEGVRLATGETLPETSPVLAAIADPIPFAVGQKVRHRTFGLGEVKEDLGDKLIVEFPTRHKTLTVRAEYLKSA
jgi:hypothetical protein